MGCGKDTDDAEPARSEPTARTRPRDDAERAVVTRTAQKALEREFSDRAREAGPYCDALFAADDVASITGASVRTQAFMPHSLVLRTASVHCNYDRSADDEDPEPVWLVVGCAPNRRGPEQVRASVAKQKPRETDAGIFYCTPNGCELHQFTTKPGCHIKVFATKVNAEQVQSLGRHVAARLRGHPELAPPFEPEE
jgi:hypothetical protein